MQQVASFPELIAALDQLTVAFTAERSRLGYFPPVYRFVTTNLNRLSEEGRLGDRAWSNSTTLALFNRYYAALQTYQAAGPPPQPWRIAFEATHDSALPVGQHIVLHLIPHLLVDLSVVVARACPPAQLQSSRPAFFAMVAALGGIVDQVLGAVGRVSPALGLVRGAPRHRLSVASVNLVGRSAWSLAERLAPLDAPAQARAIAAAEARAAAQSRLVLAVNPALAPVRWCERLTAPEVIVGLSRLSEPGRAW